MSLQPAGSAPNADAMRALGHLAQAAGASEDRVQRANDDVIQRLRTALDQSENNNRLLSERNSQLAARMDTVERNYNNLEATRQAEKRASDERIAALNSKVEAMMTRLSNLEQKHDGHTHRYHYCCPHFGNNCSGNVWTTTSPYENGVTVKTEVKRIL